MDCLRCENKRCKSDRQDCNSNREEVLKKYASPLYKRIYEEADSLVSGGKAGTLSRLQEITEFCKLREYTTVGLAYCYGIESLAADVRSVLSAFGLKVASYRCTINGIDEKQISDSLGNSVGCNPVGQALAINREKVDFVIEIGLCLGHDVMFHEQLKVPFTVFIVKDRVFDHNPALALQSYVDKNRKFIEGLDDSFQMRTTKWLKERTNTQDPPVILDVRNENAFAEGHIPESINIPVRDLPAKYVSKLGGFSARNILCLCSGGIQSAYAAMFLYSRGFNRV